MVSNARGRCQIFLSPKTDELGLPVLGRRADRSWEASYRVFRSPSCSLSVPGSKGHYPVPDSRSQRSPAFARLSRLFSSLGLLLPGSRGSSRILWSLVCTSRNGPAGLVLPHPALPFPCPGRPCPPHERQHNPRP